MNSHRLSQTWEVLSSWFIALILGFAVFAAILRIRDFKVFTVLSGSMAPNYGVGSLMYIHPTKTSELKVGDVISFSANSDVDGALVNEHNVLGRVALSIPFLGYISYYIQRPPCIYIVIACGIWLLLYVFLPSVENKERKEEKVISEAT